MDVRWLITKDSVGASKTVFGVTYFPPGSKPKVIGIRMSRRWST